MLHNKDNHQKLIPCGQHCMIGKAELCGRELRSYYKYQEQSNSPVIWSGIVQTNEQKYHNYLIKECLLKWQWTTWEEAITWGRTFLNSYISNQHGSSTDIKRDWILLTVVGFLMVNTPSEPISLTEHPLPQLHILYAIALCLIP